MLKKILYWLLIALGAVGVFATAAALFVTNGVNIGTVLPGISGAALIAYGIFRLRHKMPLFTNKALRVVATSVICVCIALFVFVEAVMVSAVYAPPPDEAAGVVIVLGCGIFPDGRLSLSLKSRLDAAYEYLAAHDSTLCIVTGGQGSNEPRSEADAMKDYLVSLGVDGSIIFTDAESASTEENLRNAMAIMQVQGMENSLAAIATNDYHVYRAVMLAGDMGLRAFGLPAETPLFVRLGSYMRESLAVVNTWVFHSG